MWLAPFVPARALYSAGDMLPGPDQASSYESHKCRASEAGTKQIRQAMEYTLGAASLQRANADRMPGSDQASYPCLCTSAVLSQYSSLEASSGKAAR